MNRSRSDTDLRLRLELPSSPESVGLIRSIVGNLAHVDELDVEMVDDLRLAVSEACNNVVLHAYPDASGPLIFSLAFQGDWIEAVVRDQGCGIRASASGNRGLGMGLTLVNSLADRAEFESSALGTEVRMRFRRRLRAPEPLDCLNLGVWRLTDPESSGALRAPSD